MTSKYYTPEIEEFHIGFRFSIEVTEGLWLNLVYDEYNTINDVLENTDWKPFTIKEKLSEGKVRIKYLDREDIEILGFEFDGEAIYKKLDVTLFMRGSEISIYDHSRDYSIFKGTIKNKSELVKLLKQLDI